MSLIALSLKTEMSLIAIVPENKNGTDREPSHTAINWKIALPALKCAATALHFSLL
jgi:hypothetical protein